MERFSSYSCVVLIYSYTYCNDRLGYYIKYLVFLTIPYAFFFCATNKIEFNALIHILILWEARIMHILGFAFPYIESYLLKHN